MKKTSFLLFAAVAVCACCKTAVPPPPALVEFTAGGDGLNACVETSKTSAVTSLSSFNVLCFKGEEGQSSATQVWNATFSGKDSFTGGRYWPAADENYRFYASNAALTFDGSGSYLDKSEAVATRDVIVAKCLDPTFKESNLLKFEHIFARIGKCCILPPAGFSDSNISDLKVTIAPLVSGKYTIGTDTWTESSEGSRTTLATVPASTVVKDLWLLPGRYTLSVAWTFTQGNFTKSYQRTAGVSLSSGVVNNISATLPGPSGELQEVVFTVTVAPWKNLDVNASWNAE